MNNNTSNAVARETPAFFGIEGYAPAHYSQAANAIIPEAFTVTIFDRFDEQVMTVRGQTPWEAREAARREYPGIVFP